jgi:hypothetical protein
MFTRTVETPSALLVAIAAIRLEANYIREGDPGRAAYLDGYANALQAIALPLLEELHEKRKAKNDS